MQDEPLPRGDVVAVDESERRARHALGLRHAERSEDGAGEEGLAGAEGAVEKHQIARRDAGREGPSEAARIAPTRELEVRAHASTVRIE